MDNTTVNKDQDMTKKKVKTGPFLILRKISSVVFSLATYGVIAIVIAMFLSYFMGGGDSLRVLGYSSFFIETDSMEMVMPAGTLVFTKENKSGNYEVGDDISFFGSHVNGKVVTHRIVEVSEDEDGVTVYITKGTNNFENDEDPVYTHNIIGKVIYTIPEVGIYVDYIRENLIISLVFIVSSILVFTYLYKEIRRMIKPESVEEKVKNIEQENNVVSEIRNAVTDVIDQSVNQPFDFDIEEKKTLGRNYFKIGNNRKDNDKKLRKNIKQDSISTMLNIIMELEKSHDEIDDSVFELLLITASRTNKLILRDKEKISIKLDGTESYSIMFINNLEALGYDVYISNSNGVVVEGDIVNINVRVVENNKHKNKDFEISKAKDHHLETPYSDGIFTLQEDEYHEVDTPYIMQKDSIEKLGQLIHDIDTNEEYFNEYDHKNKINNAKNINPKHALNYVEFILSIKHIIESDTYDLNDKITKFKVYNKMDLTKSFYVGVYGSGLIESNKIKIYEAGIYTFYIACEEFDAIKYLADPTMYKLEIEVVEENDILKINNYFYTSSNSSKTINVPTFVTKVL